MDTKELIKYINSKLNGLKETRYFSFKFGNPKKEYSVGCSFVSFDDDEDVKVCFTLRTHSNNVFLTATDGDPKEVAFLMAYFEFCDTYEAPLGFGHTINSESDFLEANGRVGAVFLAPETLPMLSDLPREIDINNNSVKFMYAVFLSKNEYDVKKKKGFDGLLDYFIDTKKDIIRLNSVNH